MEQEQYPGKLPTFEEFIDWHDRIQYVENPRKLANYTLCDYYTMGVKIAFGSAVFHISISKWGVEYHQAQICAAIIKTMAQEYEEIKFGSHSIEGGVEFTLHQAHGRCASWMKNLWENELHS